jgi:ankyrin repeat protein
MTPLHEAAEKGNPDVTKVLIEAGASLSAVDNMVIKPSVKLIIKNHFSSQIVLKLTFSDSVQSHD